MRWDLVSRHKKSFYIWVDEEYDASENEANNFDDIDEGDDGDDLEAESEQQFNE